MPNWCYNDLEVYGPPTDLETIWNHIIFGDGFDLTSIKPMPEVLKGTTSPERHSPDPHPNWIEMVKKGEMSQDRFDELCEQQRKDYEMSQTARAATGFPSWYEWCCKNWGTKWPPDDMGASNYIDAHRPCLTYHFATAWSPPVPLIQAWAVAYPDCYFVLSYTEESKAFCGTTVMHGEDATGFDFDMDHYPEPFATKLTEIVEAHERARDEMPETYDDHEYLIALDELEMEVMDHIATNIIGVLYGNELTRWDKTNA